MHIQNLIRSRQKISCETIKYILAKNNANVKIPSDSTIYRIKMNLLNQMQEENDLHRTLEKQISQCPKYSTPDMSSIRLQYTKEIVSKEVFGIQSIEIMDKVNDRKEFVENPNKYIYPSYNNNNIKSSASPIQTVPPLQNINSSDANSKNKSGKNIYHNTSTNEGDHMYSNNRPPSICQISQSFFPNISNNQNYYYQMGQNQYMDACSVPQINSYQHNQISCHEALQQLWNSSNSNQYSYQGNSPQNMAYTAPYYVRTPFDQSYPNNYLNLPDYMNYQYNSINNQNTQYQQMQNQLLSPQDTSSYTSNPIQYYVVQDQNFTQMNPTFMYPYNINHTPSIISPNKTERDTFNENNTQGPGDDQILYHDGQNFH